MAAWASSAESAAGTVGRDPAFGVALCGQAEGQRTCRNVLADHGAGAAVGAVAHGDRGHEDRVGTCPDARADHRAVLLLAVVIGGDVAAADVGVLADFSVTGVAQVGQLGAAADGDVLGFVEGADLAGLAQDRARAQVGEGSDGGARRRWWNRSRGCGSPLAPSPTLTSVRVVSGPTTASRATVVVPCSWVLGSRRTSSSRVTVESIQVVAGSTTVTPARIQDSTVRRLSSAPSAESWTRSLAPSTCQRSSVTTAATRPPASRGQTQDVGEVLLALGVVGGDLAPVRSRSTAASKA